MTKRRVLVDTCIIIEAHKIGCWKALESRYSLETVEKCIEEACTGDPLDPNRTAIDHGTLVRSLAAIHPVSPAQIIALTASYESFPALDDGELHLAAWLHDQSSQRLNVLFSSADLAAIRATHVMGWLNQVVSLEQMAKDAGVNAKQLSSLSKQYGEAWLRMARGKLLFGHL